MTKYTSCEDIEYPVTREEFDHYLANDVRVACPCCGAVYNTLYKRRVYKSVLKALILLYKGSKAANPSSIGDFTKLFHFGLVEPTDHYWAVTKKGEDFIMGKVSIPKYAYIRNNALEGYSNERVFIHEI